MTTDRINVRLDVPKPLMDHARASVIAMVDASVSDYQNVSSVSPRVIERMLLDVASRSFVLGYLDWVMHQRKVMDAAGKEATETKGGA